MKNPNTWVRDIGRKNSCNPQLFDAIFLWLHADQNMQYWVAVTWFCRSWQLVERDVDLLLRSRTNCWGRMLRRSWETKRPGENEIWQQNMLSRPRQMLPRRLQLQNTMPGIKG